MAEQGELIDELRSQIERCFDLQTLEQIYLPFKPKRRTRATIAREKGLQQLADLLLKQVNLNQSRLATLQPHVNPSDGVPDTDSALEGALDIIAEGWSEVAETRQWFSGQAMQFGKVVSKIRRGKKTAEVADKFEYFDRQETVARIPGHRVWAMFCGVSEGILRVGIELDG